MRRSDREITDHDEILKVIAQCDVCRIALNDDVEGVPYILPLNFGYATDGGLTLYFHGANEGYKYDVIGRNPMASFEMDCRHRLVSDEQKGHCTMEYQSVIGRGCIEMVKDETQKLDALTLITDRYHDHHFAFNPAAAKRTTVMALRVTALTAKQRMVKHP